MSRLPKVAVIVGSLSRNSANRAFATALGKAAAHKLDFHFVELGELPLYNHDYDADYPAAGRRFKKDIESADAVLFVTPEYNRTFSAVIKNAIEWGSRPWGQNSWAGRPGAVIGVTPGAVGTSAAQSQLRAVVPVLDIALLAQPELYINIRPGQIDENGEIVDDALKALVDGWVERFSDWIARLQQRPVVALGR